VSEATHDAGGTLDVVCVRGDLPLPAVDVVDVGLSDHRLLRWTSQLYRPPSLYTTAVGRRWTLFDVDVFRADLLTSSLCDVGSYVDLDGHALATLYESTVSQLLDRQIPARSVTCRRRTSSLWFDDECRSAKQAVRTLERSVRRAGLTLAANTPTVKARRAQRRAYFSLLHKKRSEFWTARFDVDQTQPRRLWRSFDELLGRRGAPPTTIDAAVFHRHFDDKVAGVRAATAGAGPPTLPVPAFQLPFLSAVFCSPDLLADHTRRRRGGRAVAA